MKEYARIEIQPHHREEQIAWLKERGYAVSERWDRWAWKLPEIIPWVEENHNDLSSLEQVIIGLHEWHKVADRAIVTMAPGLNVYAELWRCVPDMQIIPGLKTNNVLAGFDDVKGWAYVATELADMAEATGSSIVVLENETAVEKYRLGREAIDWDAFRKCLKQLPKDLMIWWYPAMTGEDQHEQVRMKRLSLMVAQSCDSAVLLDHQSRGGPRGLTYSWSIEGREKLDAIARNVPGTSILPMLYFYGPGSRYWMDDQILEALGVVGGGRAIIYPGAAQWVKAAKLFVAALGALPAAESKTISGELR